MWPKANGESTKVILIIANLMSLMSTYNKFKIIIWIILNAEMIFYLSGYGTPISKDKWKLYNASIRLMNETFVDALRYSNSSEFKNLSSRVEKEVCIISIFNVLWNKFRLIYLDVIEWYWKKSIIHTCFLKIVNQKISIKNNDWLYR